MERLATVLGKMRIRTKIVVSFMVFLIPLFLTTTFVNYLLYSKSVLETTKQNNMLVLKNVMQELDNSLKDMERISLITFSDKNLQGILEKSFIGYTYEYLQDQKWVEQFFLNLITIRNEISTIRIVTSNQVIYKYNKSLWAFNQDFEYTKAGWYKTASYANGNVVILGTHELDDVKVPYTTSTDKKLVFSIARQINRLKDKKPIGYIKLDSDLATIADIIDKYKSEGTELIVYDDNFNIIYHKDSNLVMKRLNKVINLGHIPSGRDGNFIAKVNGKKVLVTKITSKYSNWKVICLTPDYIFRSNAIFIRNLSILLVIISIILAVIISVFISKAFSKPIIALNKSMRSVEEGNLDVNIKSTSEDEIGELTNTFNNMVKRLLDLIQNVYLERIKRQEAEIRQKSAELGSLQNQINPHFLYNTLDTIRITAALNKDKAVEDMLFTLSNFFRLSIYKGEDTTTIQRELNLIKCYLQIQKYRFKDKIECYFDIPEDILECEIPRFILQPIVENSIHHGLEMKKGKGSLVIKAVKNGECLRLYISDDGKGMAPDEIEKYNMLFTEKPDLSNPQSIQHDHIGLVNVHQRICLMFGYPYGLRLVQNPEGGLTTIISLKEIKGVRYCFPTWNG